jgi:folylpolyglutamate synthase/dihydropteroate synthase
MVADKNLSDSLKEIAELADHIIFTRSLTLNANRKSAPMQEFKNLVKKLKIKAKIDYFLDPWQALEFGLMETESADCMVITGSMYLTGNLREKWIDEDYILKNRKSF